MLGCLFMCLISAQHHLMEVQSRGQRLTGFPSFTTHDIADKVAQSDKLSYCYSYR